MTLLFHSNLNASISARFNRVFVYSVFWGDLNTELIIPTYLSVQDFPLIREKIDIPPYTHYYSKPRDTRASTYF